MYSADNFSNTQKVSKVVIKTAHGVVASQHKRAAQVGAKVLEEGGDAVDAAIATSFALGVVEPWMSGLAAGGCMVLWRAQEQKAYAIEATRDKATSHCPAFFISGKFDHRRALKSA